MSKDLSRREFLKDAAIGALGVATVGILGGCADSPEVVEKEVEKIVEVEKVVTETEYIDRKTVELPITDRYEMDRPEQTEYEVDVLVIGCGYAGLNAAYSAKQAGKNVMVLDKGRPGFSGQSPWPGTFNYFDPDMGDDETRYREYIRYGNDFVGNLKWVDVWIKESKAMKDRIESFGLIDMYPQMFETEYWETRDYYGYKENVVGDHERRPKFVKVLDDNNIPWLQHVMVTNLIVQGGKCVGAIGFQFTTGAIITVHAKAVVLAAGNGCVTPTGHPIGDNTFDAEYMAYQLGLPIAGKEFEDFHTHQSFGAGSNWLGSDARFFDPNFLCGGNVTEETVQSAIESARETLKPSSRCDPEGAAYFDVQPWKMEKPTKASAQSAVYGINPDEKRIGKMITPYVKMDAPGAAAGMCLHMTSGVFCDLDDTEGYTGIPGLWVCGDGPHASNPTGASYKNGNGFTTCFCAITGDHAGKAAAAYADTVQLEKISNANYNAAVEEIEQPLKLEKGFAPMWARDVLQGIMGPYYIQRYKDEETLNAALVNVRYLKRNVSEHLLARSGHDLRLCHEMKHKINACELKLLAAIARKESRGENFYRADYPHRDNENWLKYIIQKKGDDGNPVMSFVDVPAEWGPDGAAEGYKM